MKKQSILTLALTAPLLVPSIASAKGKQQSPDTEKKNVIFIICDDMRLDMAQYAGGVARTPNIDELRNESVDFTNACTTTGLSTPSRAALFTGKLGHRTGLEDNVHLWGCRETTLAKEHSTLFEWADLAGYNIGHFGKWHVGYITPDMRGADECKVNQIEREFKKPKVKSFEGVKQYYTDYEPAPGTNPKKIYKQGDEKPDYYTTLDGTYDDSEPKKQVDMSIDFLNRAKDTDKPFFLSLGFHYPHPPYRVPEPYNTMYDYRDVELPSTIDSRGKGLDFQYEVLWPWMDTGHMTYDDWKKTISYSRGMITLLDRTLGELFDAVKANGYWDNTLIIFTSDQGSMLAEHGLYDKGPYAYEGLMRIPMLMKVPGVEAKEIEHQVSLIDLNETMVEYMGLEPIDEPVDSRSLLTLAKEGDEAWKDVPDEAFYRYEMYNGKWFGVHCIRTPKYKYTFNPNGVDQLYDIEKDPHETTNLINNKKLSSTLKDLRIRLLTHLRDCGDTRAYDMMRHFTKTSIRDKE